MGDNVGDIAGMGADLFGSFAEATCAALVISSVSALGTNHLYSAMQYPLLISACGIIVCLATAFIATDLKPARMVSEIESTLKYQLIISTVLATPARPLTLTLSPRAWCPRASSRSIVSSSSPTVLATLARPGVDPDLAPGRSRAPAGERPWRAVLVDAACRQARSRCSALHCHHAPLVCKAQAPSQAVCLPDSGEPV